MVQKTDKGGQGTTTTGVDGESRWADRVDGVNLEQDPSRGAKIPPKGMHASHGGGDPADLTARLHRARDMANTPTPSGSGSKSR